MCKYILYIYKIPFGNQAILLYPVYPGYFHVRTGAHCINAEFRDNYLLICFATLGGVLLSVNTHYHYRITLYAMLNDIYASTCGIRVLVHRR